MRGMTNVGGGVSEVIENLELGETLTTGDIVMTDSGLVYKSDVENINKYEIDDLEAGSEVVFNSESTFYTSITRMTDDIAIVTYQDGGNSYYGTSCILDIDWIPFTGKIGQLLESGEAGESKDVLIFKDYSV